MSDERSMICVVCPIGCRLTVEPVEGGPPEVSGNRCKRGLAYAASELTDPRRVLTALVRISRAEGKPATQAMLPCKSREPVPKPSIPRILSELHALRPVPPIRIGDLILKNAADTGIDIIATRDVLE